MQKDLISMGNDLIEAKFVLKLSAQKLVSYYASLISKDDDDFKTYEIPLKKVQEILGWSQTDSIYDEIKTIARETKPIEFEREKSKQYGAVWWFSKLVINDGILYLRSDPSLKPFLIGLHENFTKLERLALFSLTKSYSVRLFQLLKKNSYNKKTWTWEVSVDKLRWYLDLPKKKYPTPGPFRKFVIDKLIIDINDKTPYYVSYKVVKSGKKIVGFIFSCEQRNKERNAKVESNDRVKFKIPKEFTLQIQEFVPKSQRVKFKESCRRILKETDQETLTWYLKKLFKKKRTSYPGILDKMFADNDHGERLQIEITEEIICYKELLEKFIGTECTDEDLLNIEEFLKWGKPIYKSELLRITKGALYRYESEKQKVIYSGILLSPYFQIQMKSFVKFHNIIIR